MQWLNDCVSLVDRDSLFACDCRSALAKLGTNTVQSAYAYTFCREIIRENQ